MFGNLLVNTIQKRKLQITEDFSEHSSTKNKKFFTKCTLCRKLLYYALIKETRNVKLAKVNLRVMKNVIYYYGCNECMRKVDCEDLNLRNCGTCKDMRNYKFFCDMCTKVNIHD